MFPFNRACDYWSVAQNGLDLVIRRKKNKKNKKKPEEEEATLNNRSKGKRRGREAKEWQSARPLFIDVFTSVFISYMKEVSITDPNYIAEAKNNGKM